MNIGIFINNNYNETSGGGFSYENTIINLIDKFNFSSPNSVTFILDSRLKEKTYSKKTIIINYQDIYKSYWSIKNRLLSRLLSFNFFKKIGINNYLLQEFPEYERREIRKKLTDNHINTIYFLTPGIIDYGLPYIVTHWDLGHISMFSFPEVCANGKYENREMYHRINLKKAIAIITESNTSIEELITYENINRDRLWVLPMFPGQVIDLTLNTEEQNETLKKYNISKNEFFFYPAQFWAHKNHYTLLLAFKEFIKTNNTYKLVLSGSDAGGNLRHIAQLVKDLYLSDYVIFTGFVDIKEIHAFYLNATALVMPTLLGPTNMPLLEALHLGCPVLCSNLKGHIEMLQDKALYFNPLSQEDILLKMLMIIDKRQTFIFNYNSETIKNNTIKKLDDILLQINKIRILFP